MWQVVPVQVFSVHAQTGPYTQQTELYLYLLREDVFETRFISRTRTNSRGAPACVLVLSDAFRATLEHVAT